MPVGRLVLNRNPDNFFAETEQVAFCVAHVVPGIDFSNDPLLAGRIHSYVDTQISRLGGPNFHEIPINAPVAPVHNNQRDGMHRQAIHRGRVVLRAQLARWRVPVPGRRAGLRVLPRASRGDDHKVRGKAERFADHYTQATLFWNSQSAVEQQHIINAFRFELAKVQTPAVRERMVSGLMNVATELAEAVAAGLGLRALPAPMPKVQPDDITPEVLASPALSLFARPGDGSISARRVALLVADGCHAQELKALADRLTAEGAVPRFVGPMLGPVAGAAETRSKWTSVSTSRRRCSSTRWCYPVAPTRWGSCKPTAAPWSSSRISTAIASRSSRWARGRACCERVASTRRSPMGRKIGA